MLSYGCELNDGLLSTYCMGSFLLWRWIVYAMPSDKEDYNISLNPR